MVCDRPEDYDCRGCYKGRDECTLYNVIVYDNYYPEGYNSIGYVFTRQAAERLADKFEGEWDHVQILEVKLYEGEL